MPVPTASQTDRPRLCCFCHDGDLNRRCPQPARFYVYSPPWTYDDYTETCGDHVADMKCGDEDRVERI